jgi:uncharacterized membrane-anchored protein
VRKLVLWGVLALTLVTANLAIAGKERILSGGNTVYLVLLPVDPRSLLQGDYMALRYALAEEVGRQRDDQVSVSGRVVVTLDVLGVARFVRFDDGSGVADGEQLLQYRKRGEGVRIASEAFFFQEGQGPVYQSARYGELMVNDAGKAVLVGLRDEGFKRLRPDTE